MFRNLSPGAIGIRATLEESIELAKATGFEGVDVGIGDIAKRVEETGLEAVRAIFEQSGIRPGGWGLPVNWQGEQAQYDQQVKDLLRLAKVGKDIGCTRVPTWVPPASNERDYGANVRWHVERFTPIAEVLGEHGCWLGLEFIGPKTSRAKAKYEFIWTMSGMLELCDAIGTGNVGLLLDAWHWYTSHGTLDELRALRPEQVVYVHINDAPAGVAVDEQIDNIRCLPGETGVIDLVGFLKALDEIGYDGPVTPEPFSKRVAEMPAQEAAKTTAEALIGVWTKAGLS